MRFGGSSVLAIALMAQGCSEPPALSRPAVATASPSESAASSAPAEAPSGAPSSTAAVAVAPPDPNPPLQLTLGGKVKGEAGLVTSVESQATHAGVTVLEKGGNAVDAAVAVAYALAVTHPSAGNIGGGGFMLVKMRGSEPVAIDFRETAPAAVTTKKVLDEIAAGAFGYHSVAVPGTVAGLNLARDRFGTVPLADLMAPAIALAKGHRLAPRAALALKWQWDNLKSDPAARAIFGKDKKPLAEGDRIVQADLAKTLEAIAKDGDAGFYQGTVAERIDAAMKKNGGDITKADLAAYAPVVRKPLRFRYRGFDIDTMPPPSMGGVAFAETLLSMERLDASQAPLDSTKSELLFVESAKRAYADRRTVGADPDFAPAGENDKAVARLLSPAFLASRTPKIDPDKPTPSTQIAGVAEAGPHESPETTHFSVVDKDGNAVSCTVTLSASFGAKIVIPKTGILLSNALGAFSASGPNEAAPKKRMASSMSPTLISREGDVVAVVGSPGGDTIPNTMTQLVRNLVDYGMTADGAVTHARIHHQLLPDAIRTERQNPLPPATLKKLEELGYKLEPGGSPIGDGKVIVVDPKSGMSWGAADDREGGLALGAKKMPAVIDRPDKPDAKKSASKKSSVKKH